MEKPTVWIGLGPTTELRMALAELIIQWAFFESDFDDVLRGLLLDKRTKRLTTVFPYSFRKRLKLFKDASKICFSEVPPLYKRLTNIHSEARNLKKTRDHVAHCRWLGTPEEGGIVTRVFDGKNYIENSITVALLETSAVRVSALSRQVMNIMRAGFPINDHVFPLEQAEIDALLEFASRNFPPLPTPSPVAPPPRQARQKKRAVKKR